MVYTPNIRKCPLLYSTVPRDTPSLPVLFRMSRAGSPATLNLLWGSTPGLTSTFYVSSTPNLAYNSDHNNRGIHNNCKVLGSTKCSRCQGLHTHTTISNCWSFPKPDQLLHLLEMKTFAGHSIPKYKSHSGQSYLEKQLTNRKKMKGNKSPNRRKSRKGNKLQN